MTKKPLIKTRLRFNSKKFLADLREKMKLSPASSLPPHRLPNFVTKEEVDGIVRVAVEKCMQEWHMRECRYMLKNIYKQNKAIRRVMSRAINLP